MIHHHAVSPSIRTPGAILVALALGLALALPGCDAPPPTALAPDAPELAAQVAGDVIPGRFIVTVRPGFDPRGVAAAHGVTPTYVYTHALNGFAGEVREAARSGLLADARVLRVEPDRWVFPHGMQEDPPWHLDRIDQRHLPMDGLYQYNRTGAGVTVYIIDSGIRFSHQEFGGRARNGYDFVWHELEEGDPDRGEEEGEDCRRSGHGTSVAALAGGNTVGVARAVELVSVRMFGCEEPSPASRTIAAVDWVTAHHEKPALANMSLGSSSEALDDAVRNSIAAGVTYTVSAGNRGNDGPPPRVELSCNQSPARVREALTVAATDHLDRKPSWSSYGECVDLFAPGEEITTAIRTADDAYRVDRWGTSFSAPLVAGVAALYLQEEPTALPAQVFAAVIDATTKNIVTDAGRGTTNNHLLFSLAWDEGVDPPPPPPPPPPAAPSGLAATAISASQIDLAWTDNSDDEDGFRIERCTGAGCTDFAPLSEVGKNTTAYSDTGLDAETSYRYRVAAFNEGGDSDWSDIAEATTLAEEAPPVEPTGPTAAFDVQCEGLECIFTDQSTAGDSGISAWAWDFGDDNGTSTAQSPTYTYPEGDTYTVMLTVTDGNDLTDTATKVVTVAADDPGPEPDQPSIDLFHLTDTSNPQFARVLVKWAVSGAELQEVVVTVDGEGNLETRTWTVSGTSAADEHEFSFRRGHGSYLVTLTVTAAESGPVSETKKIVLNR